MMEEHTRREEDTGQNTAEHIKELTDIAGIREAAGGYNIDRFYTAAKAALKGALVGGSCLIMLAGCESKGTPAADITDKLKEDTKTTESIRGRLYDILASYEKEPSYRIVDSSKDKKTIIYNTGEGNIYELTLNYCSDLKETDSHAARIAAAGKNIEKADLYRIADFCNKKYPLESIKNQGTAYSQKALDQFVVTSIEKYSLNTNETSMK